MKNVKIDKVGDTLRLVNNGQQIGKSQKDFQKLCYEINHNKVKVENLGVIPESYHHLLNVKRMRVDEILLTSGFTNPLLIS